MQTYLTKTWRGAALLIALCTLNFSAVSAVQLDSVSALAPAAGGGGDSVAPILSPDGRYVLFTSVANNLSVTSSNTPYRAASGPRLNVFLRDRTNATTTLVSLNALGTGGGNGDSIGKNVSTNGQYALFESAASDLVAGDTNKVNDIFVRDLLAGTNRLVSISTNGGPANGPSRDAVMTPDGRYVAFVSSANNLVPNDSNGLADIFVADLVLNTMTLASVDALSYTTNNGSEMPDISADGRYVAFYSTATNLVPGVNTTNIYVRDLVGATTLWASANARTLLQTHMGTSNAVLSSHVISEDGNYVVFRVGPGTTAGIILRHDLVANTTELVASNVNVILLGAADEVRRLDVSPDGRFVAYVANTNANTCIYLWDGLSGQIQLVTGDLGAAIVADNICGWPTVDSTGRYVAFLCSGSNNVAVNVPLGSYHVYVRDMQAGTTKVADTGTNGVPSGASYTGLSGFSTGGRFIAFQAPDGRLVPGDWNRAEDIFLRDLLLNTNELISARENILSSDTPTGLSGSPALSVSADGRFVAFASLADDVTLNDTNRCTDIFVRDVMAGVNYMVSVATNGWSPTNVNSTEASISGDGRYVAFSSAANSLIANDANGGRDVFVRDLLAGTTTLVSVKTNPPGSGNGESFAPVSSADGQKVLFQSAANNLVPGMTGFTNNLFYRNLQSGTTYALTTTPSSPTAAGVYSASMTPDGRWVAFIGALGGTTRYLYVWDSQTATRVYTNTTAGLLVVSISPDGSRLAYITNSTSGLTPQLFVAGWAAKTNWLVGALTPPASYFRAGLRFSADGRYLTFASKTALTSPDTNATYDVYLYDLQTRSNRLVSHRLGAPDATNDASDTPDISPDGRFVAYRSYATNIIAGDNNGVGDAFLYDRDTDTSTLLSVSRFNGGPADSWSFPPQFTRDGHQVVFQSWASDLAGLDFNLNSDVFGYAMFYVNLAPGGLPVSGPTLSWPVEAGKTYQVEYLDDLNNSNWQNVGGTVTILNGWAYFTDPAPSPSQRHYRIVAN